MSFFALIADSRSAAFDTVSDSGIAYSIITTGRRIKSVIAHCANHSTTIALACKTEFTPTPNSCAVNTCFAICWNSIALSTLITVGNSIVVVITRFAISNCCSTSSATSWKSCSWGIRINYISRFAVLTICCVLTTCALFHGCTSCWTWSRVIWSINIIPNVSF